MDLKIIIASLIFMISCSPAATQNYLQNNPEFSARQFTYGPIGDRSGFSIGSFDYGASNHTINGNFFNSNFDRKFNFHNSYYQSQHVHDPNVIIKEATYFIVAGKIIRPGMIYRIAVSVLQAPVPLTVHANIQRDGVQLSSESKEVKEGVPETFLLKMPRTSNPGHYKLRVEGTYQSTLGGIAFMNETTLTFSQKSMSIFIQTDKPVYMQGQTVRFRTIPITTKLLPFDDAVDVYMLDPNRRIMRRWLSRQSNLGTVSLSYQLSDQPVFGEWIIQITAQGQVEEGTFMVEEYYQTRYEVNVTMPAFFFDTDRYIYGTVMANYTSGAPVYGNLTLQARIKSIFSNHHHPRVQSQSIYLPFHEELPSWYPKKEDDYKEHRNRNSYYPQRNVPYLKFFNGVYHFKYPMQMFSAWGHSLDGLEIKLTATVGDKFLNEVIEGYSIARIYNSSVKVTVLGGSPQVFKPAMPFPLFIAVSFQDNSPLELKRLQAGRVHVQATILMNDRSAKNINFRDIRMSNEYQGVWELNVDLKTELGLSSDRTGRDYLNRIRSIRCQIHYQDSLNQNARTEVYLTPHYSPLNRHIKVSSSTHNAKVGEYFVLHVQSNYYMELFNYVVMAKGMVLLTGQETIKASTRTFTIPLSPEMAPAATILVYHVGHYGQITADSLTFPVNGISRNNFTVYINNRKAKTGEKVEVAIYGKPGAYVALSGIDKAFYTMQAGNELTYSKVIDSMARFDEDNNGTFMFSWLSHEGNPDENVYFPSGTFGVDANRTFEYNGLIVFTDVVLPRIQNFCDKNLGLMECMSVGCYHKENRCNGINDCEDGSDESNCSTNVNDLAEFRKNRFNRIQRQYDNVWLWEDINIGPHGRYIFEIDVPKRPVHWMVSAFSMTPSIGFGMLQKPLEYMSIIPFYIEMEMPAQCRQGEQVGIRVAVFNYQTFDLEVGVIIPSSEDYRFVLVGDDGIVRSYNPETSNQEKEFLVYIEKQSVELIYLPIVPTRLGDINVTVHVTSLIGEDFATKTLHVEADGLPQYRHQSILLDLSNRAYVLQYLHVNVTDRPIIPYSEDRYYVFGSNKAFVSLVGDVVGPIFPTMPMNASSLLHLPMDCGEQNIFSFAANLYTLLYMRYINQRDKNLEKQAFYYMNIGYQKQLSFMNPDGSFSFFRSDWSQSSPSVWLTAYCARIFQEASFYEWENYIYIDPDVIYRSVEWVLKHQTHEGAFFEVTWLPDRKANSSSYSESKLQNVTLTAHVLIMLDTVKDLSGGLGSKVALAQTNAMKWLEKNLKLVAEANDPYEVAIVAYALLLSQSTSAEAAYGLLSRRARSEGGYTYWSKEPLPPPPNKIENQKVFSLPRLPYKHDSVNIEGTAYALLVYTARQDLRTEQIVNWLNSQRLTDGGWASTQDTAVALKALIEYTNRQRIRDVSSLTVDIEATALPGQIITLYVNEKNRAQLQVLEIPNAWGTVKVQAKGAGYAILQLTVQYNVDIPKFQTEPPVRAFDLRTRANFHGRNQSHITYRSCARWTYLEESVRSGMAVLDVTIPTGYIIQQQDLDAYTRSRRVRNLQRAKFATTKVLFYFDYLDYNDICVDFTVERWYPVANMSRYLPIRVYDYYAPERFNETIFDSLPTYILNICEVCGSIQCPYCPIYNIASLLSGSSCLVILFSALVMYKNLVRTTIMVT